MGIRGLHANIKWRLALDFTNNTLGNMVLPFMAVYFAKTLGTAMAGTAALLNVATGIVFSLIGGYYADRLGRKRVFMLSSLILAAAYAVMAAANSPWMHSALITLAMMTAAGAGKGLGQPAMDAMLIDVSTPENRKEIYRLGYWANNLSISAAGAVGGFLFSRYLSGLLAAVSAASLLSLALTALFIRETQPAGTKGVKGKKNSTLLSNYSAVARDWKYVLYILSGVLVISVELNITNYIAVRLARDLHHVPLYGGAGLWVDGLQMVGYLRAENTLCVVVLAMFAGRLLRAGTDKKLMLLGMFLNNAGYSYLAIGHQPLVLMLFMLAATVGELVYVPLRMALLVELVPDHARSVYMAVNGLTGKMGNVISGSFVILGGFLSTIRMAELIFATGLAGIALLAVLLPILQQGRKGLETTALEG